MVLNLTAFSRKKANIKFLCAFLKSFINYKTTTSNPLQHCLLPMNLKIVPKAGCDHEIRPMREMESRNKLCGSFKEQFLELVKVFAEASRNFVFICLLKKVR
jgi:hypothetical protein